jgi:hypothetical protein
MPVMAGTVMLVMPVMVAVDAMVVMRVMPAPMHRLGRPMLRERIGDAGAIRRHGCAG